MLPLASVQLAERETHAMGWLKINLWILLIFISTISPPCSSQVRRNVCSEGKGHFSVGFPTGITVTVGPSRNGGFSQHTCDAKLQWGNETLQVAQAALEVDIDVMGADFGLRTPVVAFQFKESDHDNQSTYVVYSLQEPPRLLRTITGGDNYSTEDVDLEGRNAIWTNDAAVIDGFENIPRFSFDFAPTVVLRFEHERLIDAGSEFQPHFDRQIAELRSQIDAGAMSEFKNSDGKLAPNASTSAQNLRRLQEAKIKVLEMVWSYLYSGREQQAWKALAEMWPPADLDRIRAALQDTRSRGILRQVDEPSGPGSATHRKRHAIIYDMVTRSTGTAEDATGSRIPIPGSAAPTRLGEPTQTTVDVGPKAIYLGIPAVDSESLPAPNTKVYLNLLIDAAGKVRSAQLENSADKGPIGDTQLRASSAWNFIPAFKAGRAVACRIRLGVSPEQ